MGKSVDAVLRHLESRIFISPALAVNMVGTGWSPIAVLFVLAYRLQDCGSVGMILFDVGEFFWIALCESLSFLAGES